MGWDAKGRKIYKKVQINGITYTSNKIVEILINDSIIESNSLQLGSTVASRCDLIVSINTAVPYNAQIIPYVSLDNISWVKLGTFFVDSRTRDEDILILTCFDKLYLANKQFTTNTSIEMDGKAFVEPASINEIFADVCSILDVSTNVTLVNGTRTIESLSSYTVTIRNILSLIASSNGGNFKINRDGVLVLIKFNNAAIGSINSSLYSDFEEINLYKEITQVIINTDKEEEGNYIIGSDTSGEALIIDNRWLDSTWEESNNAILAQLPFSYMPISAQTRGDPTINVGDKINIVSKSGTIVSTYILTKTLKIGIGLSQELYSPSNTEAESEFGRFDIKDLIDDIEDKIGINDLYTLTLSGNAVLGEDYLLTVHKDYPLDALPWGAHVTLKAINTIWIGMVKLGAPLTKYYKIKDDIELNISARSPVIDELLEFPEIFIETYDPTNEGKDGDIWLVVGDE